MKKYRTLPREIARLLFVRRKLKCIEASHSDE